jgi:hypothetical protein
MLLKLEDRRSSEMEQCKYRLQGGYKGLPYELARLVSAIVN